MIKQMAIAKRKPDMTRNEYFHYIEHVHGVLSRKYNPGTLVKYTQNHIYDGAYGYTPDKTFKINMGYDSITELYFEDLPAMGQCFSDPDIIKYIAADGENFCDESVTVLMIVQEEEAEIEKRREGGIKVVYYLKKEEGIADDIFYRKWDQANEEILPGISGICRYIKNLPMAGVQDNSEHFHNEAKIKYEGSASIWVDQIETFRLYQREMEKRCKGFFNPSYSFFVCCDEVYIVRPEKE